MELVTSDHELRRILLESRRIAVLGIKPESRANRPAHFVPRYLAEEGYEIIPVPVYYPDITAILGRRTYRRVADIEGKIDVVLVFRRPEHVLPHVTDLLAARPGVVWMQSGIRHDDAAATLAGHGIEVVQDRCMMVEHRRLI